MTDKELESLDPTTSTPHGGHTLDVLLDRYVAVTPGPDGPPSLNEIRTKLLPVAEVLLGMTQRRFRTEMGDTPNVEPPEFLTPDHILLSRDIHPLPILSIPQMPLVFDDGWLVYVPMDLPGAEESILTARTARAMPARVRPGMDADPYPEAQRFLKADNTRAALSSLELAVNSNRHDREAILSMAELLKEDEFDRDDLIRILTQHLDAYPGSERAFAIRHEAQTSQLDAALAEAEVMDEGFRPRDFRVTALVSTYASQEFMAECLTDLEAQENADELEIIVIDAASPENERSVVRDFQTRHDNIRYFRTPERIGIYAAWNLAIRASTGRYLTPFSTNDRLAPDAYARLAAALDEDPATVLVFGDSRLTDTPHETFDKYTPSESFDGAWTWPDYTFEHNLATCCVGPHPMWRREATDRFGYFDERYTALADQDFFLRIGRVDTIRHLPGFTGLAWLSASALSGEDNTRDELVEIRGRHGAVHARDLLEISINRSFFTRLETLLNEGKTDDALDMYAAVRRRLPQSSLTESLDVLLEKTRG